MTPVELSIAGAEIIYNSLYDDQDPAFLTQDIAAIKLRDGTFIDVGWYPQFDPGGAYTISHHSADFREKFHEMRTRRVIRVVEAVRLMSRGTRDLALRSVSGATRAGDARVIEVSADRALEGSGGKSAVYQYA